MFTTFLGTPPRPAARDDANLKTTPANRPKRCQVRRACDWCKLMRIKCDNHRPCSNCQQADRDCAISGENQFRSIAEAVKEVKKLRAQVREFESTKKATASAPAPTDQHQHQHQQPQQHQHQQYQQPPEQQQPEQPQQQRQQQQQPQHPQEQQQRSPRSRQHHDQDKKEAGQDPVGKSPAEFKPKSPAVSSPADTSEMSLYPKNSPRPDGPPNASASRNGVRVDSIHYGVTSLPFFLTRMDQFLQSARQHQRPQLDLDLVPDIPTSAGGAQGVHPPTLHQTVQTSPYPQQEPNASYGYGYLPRAQEAMFLDLFWQTHYFSFPILNEGQFRREYKAAWDETSPGAPRKASPLIDIVIALCIQLGTFWMRHSNQTTDADNSTSRNNRPPESSCPSLGGFQYYRRCQEAVDRMIESPSITHVQCYIFSIVYLYEAGLLNRAQVVAGKAIMMAMILGLPSEPESGEPEPQKEVARRTWWSLYILDAKLSMEVGRSPMIGPSHSTCHLPSDSEDVARWLGPHYSFDATCPTWLGFQTQTLRLLDAVRSVRSVLYAKYDAIVGENGYKDFVSNASAREECAFVLTEQMKDLNAWAKQVPAGYLVARRDGRSFSTDRTPLEFEVDMIIHCQRQRLLLELQYHQYCMSLYQPFICFAPAADEPTPVSDGKAAAALAHAMTLTSMIHQTLTSTEALSGIYHVFRWQKNALFTMLGFAYTFPISGSVGATRRAIEMAIAVVDMYCDVLPEAGPVATIARALAEDVGAVVAGLSTGSNSWSSTPSSSSAAVVSAPAPGSATQTATLAAAVPVADQALGTQDWNTMAIPPSTEKMMDLGFLNELGEEGANTEAMDILWASLDPGDGSNVDSWMSMGDAMAGGYGSGEMDAS